MLRVIYFYNNRSKLFLIKLLTLIEFSNKELITFDLQVSYSIIDNFIN